MSYPRKSFPTQTKRTVLSWRLSEGTPSTPLNLLPLDMVERSRERNQERGNSGKESTLKSTPKGKEKIMAIGKVSEEKEIRNPRSQRHIL